MPRHKKARIPPAIRQAVWETYIGKQFDAKCTVTWCKARVTPFTFEVGHNVPESKGGRTEIDNLRPLCPQCNRSMSNNYTIDEFSAKFGPSNRSRGGVVSWLMCCRAPQPNL